MISSLSRTLIRYYVAEITGPAYYREDKRQEDTAYRRPVHWRNGKQAIPRKYARAALVSRMKIYGTSASANDLVEEIEECLEFARSEEKPTFDKDVQQRLMEEMVQELRHARLDDYGFERLVATLLTEQGAHDVRILSRSHEDEGADLVGTFLVSGVFPATVAVQAKHWRPDPPVGAEEVEQLIAGMEAQGSELGMVVTSGSVSEAAANRAKVYYERTGRKVDLVDGEQLAKLLIESGIGAWPDPDSA